MIQKVVAMIMYYMVFNIKTDCVVQLSYITVGSIMDEGHNCILYVYLCSSSEDHNCDTQAIGIWVQNGLPW